MNKGFKEMSTERDKYKSYFTDHIELLKEDDPTYKSNKISRSEIRSHINALYNIGVGNDTVLSEMKKYMGKRWKHNLQKAGEKGVFIGVRFKAQLTEVEQEEKEKQEELLRQHNE